MKLHFEPNLDYQLQAIEGVCDLFRGQEVCRTEFNEDLRSKEDARIACGKAHFAALCAHENPAHYLVATSFGDVLKTME
jgi:type III restriction enzyme